MKRPWFVSDLDGTLLAKNGIFTDFSRHPLADYDFSGIIV